jgi:hypothetical protein
MSTVVAGGLSPDLSSSACDKTGRRYRQDSEMPYHGFIFGSPPAVRHHVVALRSEPR